MDNDDDDGDVIVMIIAAATTITTTSGTNMLRMWNVKTKVMQRMLGQTGTVSKLFRNCPNQHTWQA
jgi:hypothetical protein